MSNLEETAIKIGEYARGLGLDQEIETGEIEGTGLGKEIELGIDTTKEEIGTMTEEIETIIEGIEKSTMIGPEIGTETTKDVIEAMIEEIETMIDGTEIENTIDAIGTMTDIEMLGPLPTEDREVDQESAECTKTGAVPRDTLTAQSIPLCEW